MANSQARLADVFADLRRRRIDLTPVLYYEPKLVRPAVIDENRWLRLTGFIETQPEQISFDMLFEHIAGNWRLFGIAVKVEAAPAPQGQQPVAEAKPAPAAKASTVASGGAAGSRTPANTGWLTDTKGTKKQ